MAAPGVGLAPGMQQAQIHNAGGFPPNFQPPANMPNINFSAPIIRLGTTGPGKLDMPLGGSGGRKDSNAEPLGNRRGMGLGYEGRNAEQQRHQLRESMMALQPPTREEIARTIFVGNIPEGAGGDGGMQRILATAGGLRRWTRVMDADNKPCTFGFAEYEDADSLGTAAEIFKDVEVPTKKPTANGMKTEDGEAPEKTKLMVKSIVVMPPNFSFPNIVFR